MHVGCIKKSTTERDLWNFFSNFAYIKKIKIRNINSESRIIILCIDRRMAFVTFYSEEDASRVKSIANRSDLWSGTLQFAKKDH